MYPYCQGTGGQAKYRALCLDTGNFAWGSEHVTRKTRIVRVVTLNHLDVALLTRKLKLCGKEDSQRKQSHRPFCILGHT
jgi:hypothetical protein